MPNEKVLENAVLVFLLKDDEVLLAIKTRNIGMGRRNGYGGGIEEGESPEEAVVRELEKESGGVIVFEKDLEKAAIVDFENITSDGKTFVCRVHIFLAREWNGEPKETEEMADPRWFKINQLPRMMPADRFWLPMVLAGKKIFGKAKYGPRQKVLIGRVKTKEIGNFFCL